MCNIPESLLRRSRDWEPFCSVKGQRGLSACTRGQSHLRHREPSSRIARRPSCSRASSPCGAGCTPTPHPGSFPAGESGRGDKECCFSDYFPVWDSYVVGTLCCRCVIRATKNGIKANCFTGLLNMQRLKLPQEVQCKRLRQQKCSSYEPVMWLVSALKDDWFFVHHNNGVMMVILKPFHPIMSSSTDGVNWSAAD